MKLVHVMGSYWHWVERDLISLGFRADDIGTPKLTLWELISIVVAAPTGTAVHMKMGSWTRQEELLANLAEQQAGVLQLTGRYPRPGVDVSQAFSRPLGGDGFKPINGIKFETYEPQEFTRKRAEYMRRNQRAAQENPEEARKRQVSGAMGKAL